MTRTPMTSSVRIRARPRAGRRTPAGRASAASSGSGGRLKLTGPTYRCILSPPDVRQDVGVATPLEELVREVEAHVSAEGWDQPARLFALAATSDLLAREPQLAGALGVDAGMPAHAGLTPVEQEELPEYATLEELLAGIAWPPEVTGAVLVVERLLLPPE